MIGWLIGSRVGRALSAALAVIAAIAGVFLYGKREGRQDAAEKAKDDYIETRKRMDAPDTSSNVSDDEWLRNRSKR